MRCSASRPPPTGSSGTRRASSSITPSAPDEAGLVELWPVVTETKLEPAEAFEPWNEDAAPPHAVDVLCGRIAGQIKAWLDKDEELESEGRKISAGDILILVRRRDPFTAPMIRALEAARRLPWRAPTACSSCNRSPCMDLVALADVLLMPEDDLSLAVVLKSPLFGLDDDDLFDLAYKRDTSLWNVAQGARPRTIRASRKPPELLSRWLARVDLTAALRILPRAARRRMGRRCASACSRGLGRRPPSRSMSFSISRSPIDRESAAVAARLRQCARARRRRDQARHGAEARRGPHHDGAWRQGPAGADRVPAGHLHAAAAPRREHLSARAARRSAGGGRPYRLACRWQCAQRTSRRPRPSYARPSSRSITGCSTSP